MLSSDSMALFINYNGTLIYAIFIRYTNNELYLTYTYTFNLFMDEENYDKSISEVVIILKRE